jgi:hypothetical protein
LRLHEFNVDAKVSAEDESAESLSEFLPLDAVGPIERWTIGTHVCEPWPSRVESFDVFRVNDQLDIGNGVLAFTFEHHFVLSIDSKGQAEACPCVE